jgi:PKD repeat protein
LPYVEIGNDRTECVGTDIVLDAGNFENYLWNNGSTQQIINVNQSGLYSVTVTDSNGCTGFDVVNIELVEYPVADFGYSVITETTVSFVDLSQYAEVYKWDFDNNGVVDSNVAGDVAYTYPQFGQYSAKLTVSNACSEVSVIKTIMVVGVDELLNSTISIYPNPVSSVLFIKDLDNKFDLLRIYDITGRIILEKNIKNLNDLTIDFKDVKSGIYNLELRNNKEIKSSRIIKN